MKEIAQLNLKILGRVQGVNFRYFVLQKAKGSGLKGWVRNEADGSVAVLAEGKKENLEDFLQHCQSGPEFATIERVEVKWGKATGGFKDFVIK
jgi:acylphosphatase